jgi:hypothetical protein
MKSCLPIWIKMINVLFHLNLKLFCSTVLVYTEKPKTLTQAGGQTTTAGWARAHCNAPETVPKTIQINFIIVLFPCFHDYLLTKRQSTTSPCASPDANQKIESKLCNWLSVPSNGDMDDEVVAASDLTPLACACTGCPIGARVTGSQIRTNCHALSCIQYKIPHKNQHSCTRHQPLQMEIQLMGTNLVSPTTEEEGAGWC